MIYSKIGGGGGDLQRGLIALPLKTTQLQSSHHKAMLTWEPTPKLNSCIISLSGKIWRVCQKYWKNLFEPYFWKNWKHDLNSLNNLSRFFKILQNSPPIVRYRTPKISALHLILFELPMIPLWCNVHQGKHANEKFSF